MEELQDAIEDAQYMTAMHDGIPRPTKGWKWPTEEELRLYLDKVRTVTPQALEGEGLCRGCLGFYLFMRFCSQQNHTAKLMAEFMEDVASFRAKLSSGNLLDVAHTIASAYLVAGSGGSKNANRRRAPSLIRYASHTSDQSRRVNSQNSQSKDRSNSASSSSHGTVPYELEPEVLKHWSEFIKLCDGNSCLSIESSDTWQKNDRRNRCENRVDILSHNAIYFGGKPLEKTLITLQGSEETDIDEDSVREIKVRMDLFDEIERLMFNHVVEMYFASFKESPLWSKLFQFLYMTETSVVEDDFALFRGAKKMMLSITSKF